MIPQWDRELKLKLGRVAVEVLERQLNLDEISLKIDLQPMFEIPTLFECRAANTVQLTTTAAAIRTENSTLSLYLLSPSGLQPIVFTTKQVALARMTVWRVDDVLDALQVLFVGSDSEIYMQVGAMALSKLVQRRRLDDDIKRLLDIFSQAGHLPSGTYPRNAGSVAPSA